VEPKVAQKVSSSAAVAATGTVTFTDGNNTLGTVTLAVAGGQDQATLTPSTLALGSHTITASYGGDGNFAAASTSLTQVVKAATATTLTSSVNPSTLGQIVTFTAAVTSPSSGTPTGTVTFSDGGSTLGTAKLAVVHGQDQATLVTSSPLLGSQTITATYGGDSGFSGSSSSSLTQVVQAATSTTVTTSLTPAPLAQAVTFTATVTSSVSGTPTGSVSFTAGATTLGTSTLSVVNGQDQATLTTSALAVGSYTITAAYGGDSTFQGSSATLTQTIDPEPPPAAVEFSAVAYTAPATAGSATIAVDLSAASSNTVTVQYQTSDGTAHAGVDYVAANGTLTFQPGQTSQTFTVTLLNDPSPSLPAEALNLALTSPSNADLCTPSSATLIVTEPTPTGPFVEFSAVG